MNDAMKFICRLTSNGANQGVIDSFSGSNSYWFASILFKRFIEIMQPSCMIQRINALELV